VECRYFGGLSEEETAAALDTSLRTVQRDWLRARAWLLKAFQGEP
jgi:DNA-directed RNA polymerase specialized sigma24 family protein